MTFQLPDEMFEKKLSTSLHFINSSGLSYEADHVFDCIRNGINHLLIIILIQKNRILGKTESEIMSLDESLKITKVLDEVRRQLSIAFFEDA
jgi:hypothetical protein